MTLVDLDGKISNDMDRREPFCDRAFCFQSCDSRLRNLNAAVTRTYRITDWLLYGRMRQKIGGFWCNMQRASEWKLLNWDNKTISKKKHQ